MDGLSKNNSVDIIKEEPKDENIFVTEANTKVEEDNNAIMFLKREDMKNEDKELRETGSTLEMLGHQQAVDETMIEKGVTKTEDASIMDYEEGISCFVVTAAAEFHVVPFRQNEDLLQENKSVACENIIEMKNNDTDNEEEMKAVIMIVDDEDEENTPLSTLNSSTEKLEYKEIKKETISNYDSCNAADTDTSLFEGVRSEPGHCRKIDFSRINFLKTLHEYHNLQIPKPNNTNTKRQVSSDLYCPPEILKKNETKKDKEDEEKIPLSTAKPISSERCQNHETKKDKENEEKIPLSTPKPFSTERLNKNETNKDKEDRRINFLKTLQEYHNLQIPKPNNTNTKRQVSSDLYCPPEILKKNETKKDKEDEEKIPLSTAKPISSERCQNHETKKDKEYEEKIPLSTPKPFSTERLKKNETNKDMEDRRINFLKTLQEYHNLQKPKPNNTNTKRKVWSDLYCPLSKQSSKNRSVETHMKGHGNWNLQEEKEDKEKTPLSTPKTFSTERLQQNETEKDKEDEEKIPLSTPKPFSTERLHKNEKNETKMDKEDEEKILLSTPKPFSYEKLQKDETKKDKEDEEKIPLSTPKPFSTERLNKNETNKDKEDRRINFLKTLQEYHNLQKPKPNNTNTKRKVWSDLYCPLSKQSSKNRSVETHMKGHGNWNLQEEKEDKEKTPLSTPKTFSTERLQQNETEKDKEDEEKIPLSTPKPFSTERLHKNEKNETKMDKEDEEKILLSTPKPFSYEKLQKDETKKDKEDEEKIPLSTPKPFSTERLNKNETNKDKEDRRINFLKTLQEYHNLQKPKPNNTNTKRKVWSDLYCPLSKQSSKNRSLETHMKGHGNWNLQEEKEDKEKTPLSTPKTFSTERLQQNETEKDKEDEEKIPLSTPKPISAERLQKHETKKDKKDEEKIPLSTPKPFSTERLHKNEKNETKKDKEDEEKIPLSTPKPFCTKRLQKIDTKKDKEDEENTPLSTLNFSNEKLENKEIKKESISNYDSCNAADTDTSLFEGVRYEPGHCRKIDFSRRTNFLKTLQEYHDLQQPKPNNTKSKRIEWRDLCYRALYKQSYKHLKSLETHMNHHGNWNLHEEKGTEEKIALSTPKPFSTERHKQNETKKNKEDGEKIPLSTPKSFYTERLQKQDKISDNNSCNAADIVEIWGALMCPLCRRCYTRPKILETHMKKFHGKWDFHFEKDKVKTRLSTRKSSSTERLENKDIKEDKISIDISTLFERVHSESGHCPEVDRRINFLEILKNYHNSKKPKTNNPEIRKKRSGLYCAICKRSYKHPKYLASHMKKSHETNDEKFSVCKICAKQFPNETALSDHDKSGCATSPIFKCDECGKIFRHVLSFKRHRTVHTGELPHLCNFCGKAFRTYKIAKKHERREHCKGKLFKCSICSFVFADKKSLITHLALHKAF